MNVLIIGNGGREHAIAQALKKSPRVEKLYCMKGNAGIAEIATLVDVDYCDVKAVGDWVDAHPEIGYTVIAPDDPLALGLADELESRGHRVFGPNKRAAEIESSKAFAKALMKKYGIPTAAYETFEDYNAALAYVRAGKFPVVLKADGLEYYPIRESYIAVAVPKGHPLEARESITLKEAAEYPQIMFSKTSGFRGLQEQIFAEEGIKVRPVCSAEELEVVIGLVENGFGISVLPYMDMIQLHNITAIPAQTSNWKSRFYIARRKYGIRSKQEEAFFQYWRT